MHKEKMMRGLKTSLWLAGASALAFGVAITTAQPQPANNAVFTAEQVTIGQAAYQATCARCHQADLRGSNEAPPLSGVNFMNAWRGRSTNDLFNKIVTSMPADNPGSVPEQAVTSIVAFILRQNGAAPGQQAFTAATAVPIGQVAAGTAPPQQAAAAAPAGDGAPAPAAAARPRIPAALTLQGNIQNFTPVTDAMLLKPDPADWIMVRGGYPGWSHSALKQVTKDNVGQLQLAWVWAMNDGLGASEATPLVHNGILYLVNVDNLVQALDAKTGDLLWENRIRPSGAVAGGTGAMRNIAIYQDKIYVASTDAHMFALDARTGRTVWDTVLANNARGFGNSSGPIIINGKIVQGLGGCERYKAPEADQGCYISGLDAQTGKILWRFNTEAREGTPGGDSWGKLPNMLRAGGDTWITGTYDPELNLTYWGVAQAKPWMQASRGTSGDEHARHSAHASLHGNERPRGGADRRLWRHHGGSPLLRDARQQRQYGQARRLRRAHDAAEMELRSAPRMAHRRADDRRRHHLRRRSRPHLPRFRYRNRQGAVEDAARHLGAGLSGLLQRRRQAVYRRPVRPRR